MSDNDLEMLEFPKIRAILAGFASFSVSHELILNLHPLADKEEIRLRLNQSAEARHLLAIRPDISIGEVIDIREAIKLAARGKVLEPLTLLDIQKTIYAAHRLHDNLKTFADEVPLLHSLATEIVALQPLEKHIGDCLSPSGDVLDSASSKLAAVRHKVREVRQQLLTHLEAIIRSPEGERIVQEPIITERGGRYVIPVKVESRRRMKSIVHDVSNTGATLFIEPWATVDMGNELRELVLEEKHEIERILGSLSAKAGVYQEEISRNIDLIAEIDLALAKARYAHSVQANEPIIDNADGSIADEEPAGILKLFAARHPLLGRKAVPLSVEIGRDFSILVITGPNTGGKTVALKTIGLLCLMVQAGLPIPASAESRIPLFDGVFADIGDEQSIEQTLSTFSWHISNIVRIINNATSQSLVLLDELGTNTDPGEGAALARAILLHFLARRTLTVATTHFTELKAFAHITDGLQNASLDVNPVTMIPTYHLTLGIPGGSNALATASRLGLLSEIVTGAREMLSQGSRELEALLADLTAERKSLDTLRRSLEKTRSEVEEKNTELDTRLRQLQAEERKVIQDTRDQVLHEAAELHKEIRKASSALRKEKSWEAIERSKQALNKVHEQIKTEVWTAPETAAKEEDTTGIGPIVAGDSVWIEDAGLPAQVLAVLPESGQVEVQSGQIKLTLSINSVAKRMPASSPANQERTITRSPSPRAVSLELNLRGKRADEVEPALDSYLNSVSLANLNEVHIIHGIGSGTVRQIVRELLTAHPLVKSFRPGERGEGGDGVTVVRLS